MLLCTPNFLHQYGRYIYTLLVTCTHSSGSTWRPRWLVLRPLKFIVIINRFCTICAWASRGTRLNINFGLLPGKNHQRLPALKQPSVISNKNISKIRPVFPSQSWRRNVCLPGPQDLYILNNQKYKKENINNLKIILYIYLFITSSPILTVPQTFSVSDRERRIYTVGRVSLFPQPLF